MSNPPDRPPSEEQLPAPQSSHRTRSVLLGLGIGLGTIAVAGTLIGVIWGDRIIETQVLPRLEAEIAKTAGRPVDLGEVERLVFWGIRLNDSTIPPTETDGSFLTVDVVDVRLDLGSLIFQQTLRPEVVLVRPDLFLEQGEDGEWLEFLLPEPTDGDSLVSLEIQFIEIQDGRLTAETLIQDPDAAVQREAVRVENAAIRAEFYGEAAQQFNLNASGDVASGGFDIEADADLEARAIKANVRAQNLPIAAANLFSPTSLGISSGLINSNLTVTAALNEANELDQTVLEAQGTARLRDGEVAIAGLEEPIRNIRSRLRFREQQVTLEATGLQVGDITLTADGTADLQEGYDLTARIPNLSLAEVQRLAAVELPVDAAGTLQLQTQVTGDLDEPRLRGQLTNAEPLQVDALTIAAIAAGFDLTRSQFDLTELRVVPAEGGILTAAGQVDLEALLDDPSRWAEQDFQLTAQARDFPVDTFAAVYGVTLPEALVIGSLTADVEAEGTLEEPSASAQWRLTESSFPAQGDLTIAANRVTTNLSMLPEEGGLVIAEGAADLTNLENPSFQLTAQASNLPVDAFAAAYNVALPEAIVIGSLTADVEAVGTLQSPTVSAQWQLAESSFPAQGDLVLANNTVTTDLQIQPEEGGVIFADAQANIADLNNPSFQLTAQATSLPVDALAAAYGVTLPQDTVIGSLSADVEAAGTLAAPTAFAAWQLAESTFPGRGELALVDNVVTIDNTRLQVADGTVTAAATAALDTGSWQAALSTEQVPIDRFTTQAEGLLSADIEASGNLNTLDLATIQADGRAAIADAQIRLTDTSEPLLERGDWDTTFVWQGDRVAVTNFTAPGVQADGVINVDFSQSMPVDSFDLNVALSDFELQPLNSLAPAAVQDYAQIAGATSFDGQLTGTLANPQVVGDARLEDLTVNELAFETLTGPVAFSLAAGGRVDLQSEQDRVQLVVSDRLLPVSFEVRNEDFVAEGYREGDRLFADIRQLPLAKLDLQPPPALGFGTLTGVLDASIEADLGDLSNPAASGTVTVTDPSLDPLDAQLVTASFRYADNTATLTQSELQLDESRFLLSGSVTLAPQPQYNAELTIAEGRVEELVALVQDLNLAAFGDLPSPTETLGDASNITTEPVGLPATGDFLDRLEGFVAFVNDRPEEDDANTGGTIAIPPVEDLEGGFSGTVAIAGASLAPSDFTAEFDIRGDRWQWGPYEPANQFVISGNVQQAALTLDPLLITSGETVVNFAGRAGLDGLTGQLWVDNLPVEWAQLIYPLPVAVAGDLDLVTRLDGTLINPIVEGEAVLVGTEVEGQSIDRASADFSYRSSTLAVDAEAAIDPTDDPITVEGRIPYALPFMAQPPSDRLAVRAIVPGGSFDVVNALSENQVRWESGGGEIDVQVGGTLAQPLVNGVARFRNGVITTDLLNDPVTNLNGDVQFNLERVGIRQLTANLGDGRVEVKGQLPLLTSGESILAQASREVMLAQAPTAPLPSPAEGGLLIAFEALPIDYDGVIQAQVDGQALISRAVLAPVIGGGVMIEDGRVSANELLGRIGAIDLPTEDELAAVNPYRAEFLGVDPLAPQPAETPPGILDRLALDNFRVVLSDRFVIAGQPFYNVSAVGDVTVNGTFENLQPSGTVELTSGWINLFANQFRLAPNAPNTATFSPEDGLDPYVDVVLTSRVRDTDVSSRTPRLSGGFAGSEINDGTNDIGTVGNVRYVRVQAIAQGPASELGDNLTLTSRPRRSQEELVALLGSSVSGGLAGASFTQFAGFLGAGSLSGFGNNIANAIGLQSFSVFPTTDTSTESTAGIGLGVETSFGIGDRIGVNILQILNNGNPPQVGVQYRLTEELQLRGSSNLNDTEVRLEYRTEF